MTQFQARINLDRFEEYVSRNWNKWSEQMRWVAMQSRRGLIKQLQRVQLKEFDNDT